MTGRKTDTLVVLTDIGMGRLTDFNSLDNRFSSKKKKKIYASTHNYLMNYILSSLISF